jgi:flagellar biosynthesis/type III secretory pathway protein FliH
MTMREEIINKLQTADDAVLERVRSLLENTESQSEYPPVIDVRVKRTPEEIAAFAQALDNFAKIEPNEDITQLLEDMKRRPSTRKTNFDS